MKNLNGIEDFSKEEIDNLIDVSIDISNNLESYSHKCDGKILATLFFEPSTRTRLSFESAMCSLGGKVIGFSSAQNSSTAKGESLADTIQVVSRYSNIIAMRHPNDGAAYVAIQNSKVPIINAGDGGHNHPTQTLLDLLTIKKELGRLDNLTIGLCGDLKYGRTVHSLVVAFSRYKNIKFVLISPDELKMPEYVKKGVMEANNMEYTETNSLEDSIKDLDILYMTRIQQERFESKEEYERLKDVYVLDKAKMKNAKENMRILHPLPRVTEIAVDVDDDPRACYFEQAENGRYMRMAIILKLLSELDVEDKNNNIENAVEVDKKCSNHRCVANTQRGLKNLAIVTNGMYKCVYCENEI